jgi:DNA-binding beta-propeller fold protein YncE
VGRLYPAGEICPYEPIWRPYSMLGLERILAVLLLTPCLVFVTACGEESNAEHGMAEDAWLDYAVDSDWLPDAWVFGPALGIHVDTRDHVWVSFRERGGHLAARSDDAVPEVECCLPSPLLLELDPEGRLAGSWMGRFDVPDWPAMAHGIYVDHQGHVWVTARDQHQVLKFSRDGQHLLTLGVFEETGGSDDVTRLGRPSNVWVDPGTNELYLADGYGNRRVIVYDADTGAYLRHWGAYGEAPDDEYRYDPDAAEGAPSRQFSTAHGIIGSHDGLIYLADRGNQRIQVFQQDGRFVMERIVAPGMDLVFSPDPEQTLLYLADGDNHKIIVLRRSDLEVLGEFGTSGPEQVRRPHGIAIDSRGNLYTAEQADQTDGRRVQKFHLEGTTAAP